MKTEDEKNLSGLFKDLKSSFKDLTKARLAYSRTKSKDTVSKCVNKTKDSIHTASKNFGLKLEENSKKYEQVKIDIDNIIADYEKHINYYKGIYDSLAEQNELKLAELTGKKDEILAEVALLKEERQKYIEENSPELLAKIEPIKEEQQDLEEKAINSLRSGNYEEAKSFIEQCEKLKTKCSEIEKPFEDQLSIFDKKRADLRKEFISCRTQINDLRKFAMILEDEFIAKCNDSFEKKEELLAKVENNKMFDKIKGFLSRSVLNKINSAQKFKKNYLVPARKNLNEFTKSVPQKGHDLKQRFHSGISNILGKGKQVIENTKDKYNDARDFASDKIQDMREGIGQAKDYVSGKIVQKIDDAYELGKRAQSAVRGSAIDKLERTSEKFQQKAQELREKEGKIHKISDPSKYEQDVP